MRSRRHPSWLAWLLPAGLLASPACDGDEDASAKVEEPTAEHEREQKPAIPNAGALIESASVELDSPNKMIPVHMKVRGTVGTLPEKHNRIRMAVACDIGGERHVADEFELSPEDGQEFELERKMFGELTYDTEGPLGDCDAWLTIRESLGHPQYRESLIAASCRRNEAWTTEGCPGLPEQLAPVPPTKEAVDVEMLWGKPYGFRDRWALKASFEYGVHQPIHPDYDFGATVRCRAGTESTEYWDNASFTDLSDLRPGERARGLVNASPDERMSGEPEQCQLEAAIWTGREKDEKIPLGTFCWTPEAIKSGGCSGS